MTQLLQVVRLRRPLFAYYYFLSSLNIFHFIYYYYFQNLASHYCVRPSPLFRNLLTTTMKLILVLLRRGRIEIKKKKTTPL